MKGTGTGGMAARDRALPDRFELMAHLRESHPRMIRLLLVADPSIAAHDDCAVVDKKDQPEALAAALRFIANEPA